MIDLLIRKATLYDGSGTDPQRADLAVRADAFRAIAPSLAKDAKRAIDADGLALMPGIIDSHTHFDAQITWDPYVRPSPALGVTTAVIGNCGFTIAPCRPQDRELTMRNLTQVEGMSLDVLRQGIALGVRDVSGVHGATAAQRQRGQHRRLRRPLVGAHLCDGRRRIEARGDGRRDRADAGDRARSDAGRRRRLREQHLARAQRRRRPADALAPGRRSRNARRWSARWANAAAASTC